MIPPLISMDLAKKHLRVGDRTDLDGEIDVKIRLATSIVMNHCKLTDIPEVWVSAIEPVADVESDDLILFDADASPPDYIRVPGNLQAALLLVLEALVNGETKTSQVLSDTVINLLTPFRDPTMA